MTNISNFTGKINFFDIDEFQWDELPNDELNYNSDSDWDFEPDEDEDEPFDEEW